MLHPGETDDVHGCGRARHGAAELADDGRVRALEGQHDGAAARDRQCRREELAGSPLGQVVAEEAERVGAGSVFVQVADAVTIRVERRIGRRVSVGESIDRSQ